MIVFLFFFLTNSQEQLNSICMCKVFFFNIPGNNKKRVLSIQQIMRAEFNHVYSKQTVFVCFVVVFFFNKKVLTLSFLHENICYIVQMEIF